MNHKLDDFTMRIVPFENCFFEKTMDLSTQFFYIALLCDDSEKENVQPYPSYKSKQIIRSVLGSNCHAFSDAYRHAYTIRNDLKLIRKRDVNFRF